MPYPINEIPNDVRLLLARLESALQSNNPDLTRHELSFQNLIRKQGHSRYSFAGWMHELGRQDILDWLYERAAKNPEEQEYLLHWAVLCRQNKNVITALHEKFPVMYLARFDNDTPLHVAARENNLELAALMISLAGYANYCKKRIQTPLHIAMANGYNAMAMLLINAGANPNFVNQRGDTCLHVAVRKDNNEMIMFILTRKTGNIFAVGTHAINIRNNENKTPFTIAAERGNMTIVQWWMQERSRPYEPPAVFINNINFTFKAAVRSEQDKIALFLLPFVDDIKTDFEGRPNSTIELAKRKRNLELVKAICLRRLDIFMETASKQTDGFFYRHFSVGYSLAQQIAAAEEFKKALENSGNADEIDIQSGAISSGELGKIAALCVRHCCECIPRIAYPDACLFNL